MTEVNGRKHLSPEHIAVILCEIESSPDRREVYRTNGISDLTLLSHAMRYVDWGFRRCTGLCSQNGRAGR